VAGHLRACADCRTVVAETARFEREEAPAVAAAPTRSWVPWLAAAAVLAIVAINLPFLLRWIGSRREPIAHLIAAAPREHRSVEARLSGFPWARPQAPARGTAAPDPADLKLSGAAGDVLDRTKARRDAEGRHAAGVAYLLIGRRGEGVAALEQAARESNDARVWNDLAAARYAVAMDEERPSQLPQALADVDHALGLDSRSAEARFNRALIVERLGVREQARKAWQSYLEIDPNSAWSVEARAHLHKLESTSRRFDSKMLDSVPPEQLVGEFPEETRRWSEAKLLGRWAEAVLSGNEALAAATLSRAKAIAEALAAFNGEWMLAGSAAAIERPASRMQLAEAYRAYGSAGSEYAKRNAAVAEAGFRRAAELFARGGSPMADQARYFAARAAFDQNRDVHEELSRLLANVDARSHRALAAQIHWTLAVNANRAGDWGTAIRDGDAATTIFRALGERTNAAFTDGIAAYALDVIGEADLAWKRRLNTVAAYCGTGNAAPCNALLADTGTLLASTGRADAATALVALSLDDPRMPSVDVAMSLAKRARVLAHASGADTRRTLSEASSAAGHIADRAARDQAEMQIAVEEAALQAKTYPAAAIAALDKAVAFCSDKHLLQFLPYVHLQRARAHRAAGNVDAAASDYAVAVRATAVQRSVVDDPSLHFAVLDTASEAIDESIELELSRGATAAAFDIADRRHALRASDSVTPLGGGAALIEYAVLPRSLVIFCVSGGQTTRETIAVDRNELARQVDAFVDAIRRRAPAADLRHDAAALNRLLITPLQPRLDGIRELVIVPDRQLHAVPFAALYDEGRARFLVEDFVIRLAPAATGPPASKNAVLAPALVVADPRSDDMPPLRNGRDEAVQIAALHAATILAGEEATAKSFVEAAPRSALIHYAGHANSDPTTSYGALLLAGRDLLSAKEIASLQLPRRPLVVLAACGTFRGDSAHAAGMSSLARAFLLAGARGVVGTLWEIDDDVSAQLFLRFHQSLRAGASPARSLRDAQLVLLRSPDVRLSHPATWSPVEVVQ